MSRVWSISRRRFIAVGAAAVVVSAAMTGAPSLAQSVSEIQSRGEINVGVLVDFPPFGLLDAKGNPEGYDVELAGMLAKAMGVKLNLVPVAGDNRIPYLLTKRVDILIAALGITPERAKQVDFSAPDAQVDQVLYAPKDREIKGLEDLAGLRVGVARGSAQDVTLTKTAPEGTSLQRFDGDPPTLQALLSGQVDAIVMSTLMIKDIAKIANVDNFEIKFPIQHLVHGIAMRKGNDDLRDWINNFLAEVKANGELNKIHRKWVGVDFVDVEAPTK
jgi:polar amino acid transport system substrate-binding protein